MQYDIETTPSFDGWFSSIKSTEYRARIIKRFDYIELGNFGDHKSIDSGLCELRFFFGAGYRVYYTIKGRRVVLLLSGGDKSTQKRDIKHAKSIMNTLE